MNSYELARSGITSGFADDLPAFPGNWPPARPGGPNKGPGPMPEPEFFPRIESLFSPPGGSGVPKDPYCQSQVQPEGGSRRRRNPSSHPKRNRRPTSAR